MAQQKGTAYLNAMIGHRAKEEGEDRGAMVLVRCGSVTE